MRRSFAPAVLSIVVLISLACAGQGPEKSGLAKELPDIVLQVNDVASELGLSEDAVRIAEARYWSNEQMADQLPGDPFRISSDLQEIQAAGRVQGYLVKYAAGPPLAITGVHVALDLYADDAAAQRVLETTPLYVLRDAAVAPRVGDASIAWQQGGSIDGSPSCRCHYRFRVGPLLATISTYYPLPSGSDLDPVQVALSEVMAERMREALEQGLPSP